MLSLDCNASSVDSLVMRNSQRGTMANISADLSELQRRLLRTRLENPDSYSIGDVINTTKGYTYLSGIDGAQRYMTVDDFIRLKKDTENARNGRRALVYAIEKCYSEDRMIEQNRPCAAYKPAAVAVPGVLSSREPVFCGKTETEYRVVRAGKGPGLLAKIGKVWKKSTVAPLAVWSGLSSKHISSAIASVSIVVTLCAVLIFPVTMSVLIHKQRNEINELDKQIASAEKTAYQLEIELDEKNDRQMLESLAIDTYGMVKIDSRRFSVMHIEDNAVETYEKEKSGGAVPALLSALGLRAED